MYEQFDTFLQRQTWHKYHALDEEVFFSTLKRILTAPEAEGFNPDAMGRYMTEHATGLHKDALDEAVEYYVAAASAVKKYLAAQ